MTTRQFITRAFNGTTKSRSCSSVFVDGGAVYSYGYHYPLLFKVAGKTVRNVRGYSSTTGRHIQWSRDIDAIDIHAPYGFRLAGDDDKIMAELVKGQRAYIDGVRRQMDAKKRKDTQVYQWLEYDLNRAIDALKALEA